METIVELKNDEELFEEKFSSLGNYFEINSPDEVYKFLRCNEGIFIILDELKPYLEEYFSNCEYALEVIVDPEIADFAQLELSVNVSRKRFYKGVGEDIEILRSKIRPSRRRLKIFSEFSINYGVCYV